ncbi:MAG: glutamate synthase-related protein [Ferroplasma sp.]
MNNIINDFMAVPSQKELDFWSMDKIAHIRNLAISGKPYKIFTQNHSLRILDNVYFRNTENCSPGQDTHTSLAGFKMSVPLYLGDMSYGALSGNPNIAIAKAADITETMAGTGEGGLYGEIGNHKRIFVQWASARFGVTVDSLKAGAAVVIKIGQGAKPGIGGHLPAGKVTSDISMARHLPEHIEAISPAPHHDIYSIEDLAQRIEALKILAEKPVFVKVAATNYIPYIVTGIARSGADGVIIDGQGAGTGATPMVIRDNLGLPVELAVASSHNALLKEGLRKNFTIIAAGRVSDSTDAAKLIALGADAVSIGTSALISMGCIMVRKCNIGFCPTALTNKIGTGKSIDIDFSANNLVNYITGFRLELGEIIEKLGLKSIKELIGRTDLLYANNLSKNTMKVLGLKSSSEVNLNFKQGEFKPDKKYLNQLAIKGEAVITSMGSNAPPDVGLPSRIIDWIRLDGAQVTRPPIDPYREAIDLGFYLCGGSVKISFPVIFDIMLAPPEIQDAIAWAALFMGIPVICNSELKMKNVIKFSYNENKYELNGKKYSIYPDISKSTGYVIPYSDSSELELSHLNLQFRNNGTRAELDIIAELKEFKNTGDIAKYIALGADSVILNFDVFDMAIEGNYTDLRDKALNFLNAIKEELSLISGAMGMTSMQNSLTGNSELLRGVNLDNNIEKLLELEEGGST